MNARAALVLLVAGSAVAACAYTPPTVNGGAAGGGGLGEGGGGGSSNSSSSGGGIGSSSGSGVGGTGGGGGSTCGDGVVQEPEVCDDGNLTNGDKCDSNCTVTGCGNAITTVGEECDDGNLSDGDGCDASCQVEFLCGNQLLDPGEACDDGNSTSGDGCDPNCTFTACGNGVQTLDEECDDGGQVAGDGCSAICFIEDGCGNGNVDLGEQCDDGNQNWGDNCSPGCKIYPDPGSCGNAVLEAAEVCDDGNGVNGDGCNPTCTLKGMSTIFIGMPGQVGTVDGIGTGARVDGGQYMAIDGGRLFIGGPTVVRMVDIASKQVTTIAGAAVAPAYADASVGTNARFGSIGGLATNGKTLWVADSYNHVLRAISLDAPYAVSTVAGVPTVTMNPVPLVDGIGAVAQIDGIRGLAYANNKVYFLEGTAAVLRQFDPSNGMVTTLAGMALMQGDNDGTGSQARFRSPRYATAFGNMLYISDTNGWKVRTYDIAANYVGTLVGTAGCGYVDGAVGANVRVHRPRGITTDGISVYFAEFDANTIRQVSGPIVSTLSGMSAACVTDCSCPNMQWPAGGYSEGAGATAKWNHPWDVVFHAGSRSLFVSDSGNSIIRRIQ